MSSLVRIYLISCVCLIILTVCIHLRFHFTFPSCSPSRADTILMFTKNTVHAIAGTKKIDILKQLEGVCQDAGLTLNLLAKPKKEDGRAQIDELLASAKSSADNASIGTFVKVCIINRHYKSLISIFNHVLHPSMHCCRTSPPVHLRNLGWLL